MLTLININRMAPLIGPVGLDYVASAVRSAGRDVEVLDLALSDDPDAALGRHFETADPVLVGVSFRNTDDCFWPSAQSFVPALAEWVGRIRALSAAPIVLGGSGFSVMSRRILAAAGADFGIRGDGEAAVVSLLTELAGRRRFERVDGLLWRGGQTFHSNRPAWPGELSLATARDHIDNAAYFRLGGQAGVETKRGCDRGCAYCADPLIKGRSLRLRAPAEVADEVECLLRQGADVLHLCDSEFNVPVAHAREVCGEFIRRGLAQRVRWYTYMAIQPFYEELAVLMQRAGCVGINFTTDSACPAMLATYRQEHDREQIASAVGLCKRYGIRVMLDLLLGGPGETPETVAESIAFFKEIDPDAVGSALGVRIYPGTHMEKLALGQGQEAGGPGIRRRYDGPIDLLKPTFYVSEALGAQPAALVRERIGGDPRFFEPADDSTTGTDHNYNDNTDLVEAIAAGARGAYWDILRKMRQ
jgi:radical SAM superfamily enzyme YgiQ (UPF0313 family)